MVNVRQKINYAIFATWIKQCDCKIFTFELNFITEQ